MPRILNAILLAAGLSGLVAARPAAAQTYDPRYPVCIEIYTIDGSHIDCSYNAMAQCAATASGQAARCYTNPYAAPGRTPPTSSARPLVHHSVNARE
jgi:hypothetical protein